MRGKGGGRGRLQGRLTSTATFNVLALSLRGSKTKVGELADDAAALLGGALRLSNDDIFRLDVAVGDARVVARLDGRAHLGKHACNEPDTVGREQERRRKRREERRCRRGESIAEP